MEQYPHLAEEKKLIVGGGSNLLFLADFDGMILSPDFSGYSIIYQDGDIVEVEVGAGVDWDEFVAHCVGNGWYGAENLSLIPGKVGAVPVQNIGAYGVEAEKIIVRVNGYNFGKQTAECYEHDACRFSYRSSLFKEQLLNQFMVTSVVFRLWKRGEVVTGYGDLDRTLREMGGPTLANVRNAVIQIREAKLPNPKKIGNAGSFFKNPVVSAEQAAELAERLPGLPVYPQAGNLVKIAAGFLIDQAGWKGKKIGRAAVHDRQALVLVNLGGATGGEILQLSEAIRQDILEKYGVVLEREVQLI
jgi:UDP-N-acetylmuramate dehydrogenase